MMFDSPTLDETVWVNVVWLNQTLFNAAIHSCQLEFKQLSVNKYTKRLTKIDSRNAKQNSSLCISCYKSSSSSSSTISVKPILDIFKRVKNPGVEKSH